MNRLQQLQWEQIRAQEAKEQKERLIKDVLPVYLLPLNILDRHLYDSLCTQLVSFTTLCLTITSISMSGNKFMINRQK